MKVERFKSCKQNAENIFFIALIQKRKQSSGLLFSFLERCLPLRASDVAFSSDAHCVSDVTPRRSEQTSHHCDYWEQHHDE